jgi:lipid II:glycine glycyltransferase (peptidoglycan interpeptide bridge formation enzyme)
MHKGAVVAMAQILTRRIGPFSIQYVPKGPALDYTDQELRSSVIKSLQHHAKASGAIFIKIDPDVVCGTGIPGDFDAMEIPLGHQIAAEWSAAGMLFSPDQVQFRNSVIVDLRNDEDRQARGYDTAWRYR